MRRHDRAHDREAEAGAAGISRPGLVVAVEALERAGACIGRQPGAVSSATVSTTSSASRTRRTVVEVPGGVCTLAFSSTGATPVLPDIGIRTLRNFSIVYPTSGEFVGRKLLKFPVVTANVGRAPGDHGARSSPPGRLEGTSRQEHRRDQDPAAIVHAAFDFGGDGHNHWHIATSTRTCSTPRTEDTAARRKRGFCFEDNTSTGTGLHQLPNSAPLSRTTRRATSAASATEPSPKSCTD